MNFLKIKIITRNEGGNGMIGWMVRNFILRETNVSQYLKPLRYLLQDIVLAKVPGSKHGN